MKLTKVAMNVRGFFAAEPSPSSSPWLESARCARAGEFKVEETDASIDRLVI